MCDNGAQHDVLTLSVNGRIFATIYPDHEPETLVPAAGAWGRQGCTSVWLDSVDAPHGHAARLAKYGPKAWRRNKDRPPSQGLL